MNGFLITLKFHIGYASRLLFRVILNFYMYFSLFLLWLEMAKLPAPPRPGGPCPKLAPLPSLYRTYNFRERKLQITSKLKGFWRFFEIEEDSYCKIQFLRYQNFKTRFWTLYLFYYFSSVVITSLVRANNVIFVWSFNLIFKILVL